MTDDTAGRDVKPAATGRERTGIYALTWRLPMLVWQFLFFVVPLAFLVYLSFWLVKNYRMIPGFDVVNWVKMYAKGYFWDAYFLTFGLAILSTVVTSVLAFPCAYALSFKVPDTVRRWASVLSDHPVLHQLSGQDLRLAGDPAEQRRDQRPFWPMSAWARLPCSTPSSARS